MPSDKDIAAIMADSRTVESVLRKAVRKALIRHRQAGRPVVEWRDDRIVSIGPEELAELLGKSDEDGSE